MIGLLAQDLLLLDQLVLSLAYLEEDGLLLSIALLMAVFVLTVALAAVWETILGAIWISRLT